MKLRLFEFGETPSCDLTPAEFETMDLDTECDPPAFVSNNSNSNMGVTLITRPRLPTYSRSNLIIAETRERKREGRRKY